MTTRIKKANFLEAHFGTSRIFSNSIDLNLDQKWKGIKIYSPMAHCNFEYNLDGFSTQTIPNFDSQYLPSSPKNYKEKIENIRYDLENSKKYLKEIYSFKISNLMKQEDQSTLSQIDLIGSQYKDKSDGVQNISINNETAYEDFQENGLVDDFSKVTITTPPTETYAFAQTSNINQNGSTNHENEENEETLSLLKKTARISNSSAHYFLMKNNWNFQAAFEESLKSKANEETICLSIENCELDEPIVFTFNPNQKFFMIYAQISDELEKKGMKGPFQLNYKGVDLIPSKLNNEMSSLGLSKEKIEEFLSFSIN